MLQPLPTQLMGDRSLQQTQRLSAGSLAAPADIDRGRSSNLAVFAAAAATIVLFALTATTTRIAVRDIDGFDVGLIRAVGAGLFAIPLIAICRMRPPRRMADWGLLLVSALGSFVAFPLLFGLGAERTSASHAGLLMGLLPLVTGGVGMIIERRTPSPIWFIGAFIASSGAAALVMLRGDSGHAHATIGGDLLVAAALILCAIGFVAGARLANFVSSWAATFWGVAVAAVVLSPFAVFRMGGIAWGSLAGPTWAALLHLTLGANILAFVSWFWALSRGGIARVAVLQFTQPAVAVLFAVMLLGEKITGAIVLAMLTIITGIILARRRPQEVPAGVVAQTASSRAA
jgi:drug/metabolite transporter (DMT)-like permease